jgi:sporulation-control protein
MVFKKLLASLGSGGAKVDTVLVQSSCYPGGTLQGTVHILGGDVEQLVNKVEVAFWARVEVESGDREHKQDIKFGGVQVASAFKIRENERVALPFTLPVPWEMPLSSIHGTPLRGMTLGVATELDIANAIDRTDLDPIDVHALEAQQLLLDAFVNIGFYFKKADLERGYIRNTAQTLPFYQEIEFLPGGPWHGRVNELEVTFITGPQVVDVILELDKRTFLGSTDKIVRFYVDHATANQRNWTAEIGRALQRLVSGGSGLF